MAAHYGSDDRHDPGSPRIAQEVLLQLLKQESQLATVCTEPAMIALAVANAKKLLGKSPTLVEVYLSPGIMKNALSAGLPTGTRKGPKVAAALGAVAGDPAAGLQILLDFSRADTEAAYRLVDGGKAKAHGDPNQSGVYVRAVASCAAGRTAEVIIEGAHTNVVSMSLDGVSLMCPSGYQGQGCTISSLRPHRFRDILDQVFAMPTQEVGFLVAGARSNADLAIKALESSEGGVGTNQASADPDDDCLVVRARTLVTAAIGARMSGTPWPVLTSGGSGNQGIMVGIPILMVGEKVGAGEERLARALLLAHIINLYIKAYMGEISGVCGASSAGPGVAAAVCWLRGGDYAAIEAAVSSGLASLYGMLCDGAKASCALKGSVGVFQGITSGEMAARGAVLPANEGIVGGSLEETLRTVESLTKQLFGGLDQALLGPMV